LTDSAAEPPEKPLHAGELESDLLAVVRDTLDILRVASDQRGNADGTRLFCNRSSDSNAGSELKRAGFFWLNHDLQAQLAWDLASVEIALYGPYSLLTHPNKVGSV